MPHATEEPTSIDTAVLQELDGEPRKLLDTIDKLRYLGVDSYVELPQIIVVGDQSSGKSSVLEAISRVKFPSKSGLCTRFATELVLRTSPEQKVHAQIIHPRTGSEEKDEAQPLNGFNKTNISSGELGKIIEEAQEKMGLAPGGFSKSVLRVQIEGPDLPQLTLVDLPGFFHSPQNKQQAEGLEVVSALTAKYMSQKSSIILAVIAGNNDLENQVVLKHASEYDPRKERTLGIITKTDLLSKSPHLATKYFNVARNREDSAYKFKLGWYVLRNRNEIESEANTSYEERDANEKEFFETSDIWKGLSSTSKGIAELRSRLSTVLFDHVKQSLPGVIKGIEDTVNKKRQRLIGLGDARSSPGEHRAYLGAIASLFERLCRDAVRGMYNDDGFFGGEVEDKTSTEDGPSARKLRARVRLLNRAFALVLAQRGLTRVIKTAEGAIIPDSCQSTGQHVDLWATADHWYSDFNSPGLITWTELNEEVKWDAISDQGTEFPGSMNPSLAFKLFKKQIVPWHGIAARHMELVMETVQGFIDELLDHVVVDSTTREAILAECVDPFLDEKERLLAEKLEELLDHYRGDYASQVDGAFLDQLSTRVRRRMEQTKGEKTANVSEFNTEGVIDSMLTYYEMSLSSFTENIMILAVENCLIRKIPDMFQSTMINSMDDTMLAALGSETRSVREEREMLQLDLDVLDRGLSECKRFRPRKLTASRPSRSSATRLSSPSGNVTATPSGRSNEPLLALRIAPAKVAQPLATHSSSSKPTVFNFNGNNSSFSSSSSRSSLFDTSSINFLSPSRSL